jgi:hypothetical protein
VTYSDFCKRSLIFLRKSARMSWVAVKSRHVSQWQWRGAQIRRWGVHYVVSTVVQWMLTCKVSQAESVGSGRHLAHSRALEYSLVRPVPTGNLVASCFDASGFALVGGRKLEGSASLCRSWLPGRDRWENSYCVVGELRRCPLC